MLTFVLRWKGNGDDNACAQEDKVNLAGAFCDCSALRSDCLMVTASMGSRDAAGMSV